MALITTITWFVHKIIKAEQIKELNTVIYDLTFIFWNIIHIWKYFKRKKKKDYTGILKWAFDMNFEAILFSDFPVRYSHNET